jgi:hypothetical protein
VEAQLGAKGLASILKTGKRSKYNVAPKERRTVDGVVFDSRQEMLLYQHTVQRMGAGVVVRQPRFLLDDGFRDPDTNEWHRATIYVGDMLLTRRTTPRDDDAPLHPDEFVVDVKGTRTRLYMRSKKQFIRRYGHTIHEVRTLKQLNTLLDTVRERWKLSA